MDRVPFIVAIAQGMGGTIVSAADGLEYYGSPGLPKVTYERNGKMLWLLLWHLEANLSLPWTSAGTNGEWSMWLCQPWHLVRANGARSFTWKAGTKFFRKWRRVVLSPKNQNGQGYYYLQGPWSPKAIERGWPSKAADWFGTGEGFGLPQVIAGNDPHWTALVDYDPSDDDCQNDVEANYEDLFG